jgi:hypothetical protein
MAINTDKQRINELMGYFGASKTPVMLRDKLRETFKEIRESERQNIFSKKTVNMALDGVDYTIKTINKLTAENADLKEMVSYYESNRNTLYDGVVERNRLLKAENADLRERNRIIIVDAQLEHEDNIRLKSRWEKLKESCLFIAL